jgi:uncharacterized membrane-anchored protein
MTTGQARWDGPRRPAEYAASKVPLITAFFWIIKLLSTAMGEATSDYMVKTINPVTAVLLGALGWAIAMVLQFRAKRYNAWIYWFAVVMVAVFGTQCADVLHIKFHIPYVVSTAFYAIVLAAIFVLWYRTEGTLSIHSIRTPRREAFYWATVLATFALGTATGDMTAKTVGLGYLTSGIVFSLAFVVVAVAHWKLGLNSILAFWIAYVLTRPIGASFADYLAFPKSVGGLNTGHAPVALVLTVIIVCLVAYLAKTRIDVEQVPEEPSTAGPSRHHRPGGPGPGEYRPTPRQVDPYSRDPRSMRPPPQDQGYYAAPRSADPGSADPRYRDPHPVDPAPRGSWQADSGPGGSWQGDAGGSSRGDAGPRDPWQGDPGPRGSWQGNPGQRDPREGDPGPRDPRSRDPRQMGPPPSRGPRRPDPWPRRDSRDPDQDAAARPREGFFAWDDE